MPGQIPPASTPPTPEAAPQIPTSTTPVAQTPAAPGAVAELPEPERFLITNPHKAEKIVKKANKQAAHYRSEYVRVGQELAQERQLRQQAEAAHAQKLAATTEAHNRAILDFKTTVLDNQIQSGLREAGATDAQVARLLDAARKEAMTKGVKVSDQFKVEGDLAAVLKTFSADFGFSGAKPAQSDTAPPGAAPPAKDAPASVNGQTVSAMLGHKRNINGALHTPGDLDARHSARVAKLAEKIEADKVRQQQKK